MWLVVCVQKKHLSKPRPVVEMGTQNADIDYDWIPKETIKEMSELHHQRSLCLGKLFLWKISSFSVPR